MSGITHEWNGTILTITSDSGTSSCDLKGDKGDDGCRGAQGIAGRDGKDGAGSVIELDTTLTVEGACADAKAVGDRLTALENAEINLDTTLTIEGACADAKAVGDALIALEESLKDLDVDVDIPVESVNGKTGAVVLSAEDVGALPADTVIPSTSGLATETYVNNAVSAKQNIVIYSTTEPSGWVNGDIWLKPAE